MEINHESSHPNVTLLRVVSDYTAANVFTLTLLDLGELWFSVNGQDKRVAVACPNR